MNTLAYCKCGPMQSGVKGTELSAASVGPLVFLGLIQASHALGCVTNSSTHAGVHRSYLQGLCVP
jgi:hypothetical protein